MMTKQETRKFLSAIPSDATGDEVESAIMRLVYWRVGSNVARGLSDAGLPDATWNHILNWHWGMPEGRGLKTYVTDWIYSYLADCHERVWGQIRIGTKMACGARKPITTQDGLLFQVGGKPAHYIEVILNHDDTYTVTHFRAKRGTYERIVLEASSDVYAEDLSETVYRFVNK
jgi:hypothetical protein